MYYASPSPVGREKKQQYPGFFLLTSSVPFFLLFRLGFVVGTREELPMPAVINNRESSLVFSIGTHLEVFGPSRKRARITAPLTAIRKLENKTASIDDLPDECLFEILRRMRTAHERSISACVSKRWLVTLSTIRFTEFPKSEGGVEVECDGCLSRNVDSKQISDVKLAAISVGTSTHGGLRKLSIYGSYSSFIGVSDRGLTSISRGCPYLKELTLWSVPSISDEGLIEIARECHLLEKLDIESCSNIGENGLRAIAKYSHMIKSVTIIDCPLVGDTGVSNLLASSALSKLNLQGLNITDYSVAVIGFYGKSITGLVLSGLPNVKQRGLWAMAKARGLQCLSNLKIESCGGMSDLGFGALGRDITSLKHLCLSKNCFISDTGLVSFVKAARDLESLRLEKCDRISETGILRAFSSSNQSRLKSVTLVKCMGIKDHIGELEFSFLSQCRSLRCLSIRNCSGFGNGILSIIGKLCPLLHHLDLNGLVKITDDGVLPLLKSFKSGLCKVSLSNCSNLTDEVVMNLCTLHGKTLKLLNLNGCSKITDRSVVEIAGMCPLLNDLDLSGCSITDLGINALSNGVQLKMEILSISGCSMISERSLPDIEKLGKTLMGLNLQKCSLLSRVSIELLSEKLWRCDVLW